MIKRQLAAVAAAGIAAGIFAVLQWAPFPAHAASITNSKHNLSATGPGTIKAATESEICVFCHVPHNAKAAGPLWNRDQPAGPYTPYTSSTSKITTPGQPTGASLLCLSCHDGTIALGKISSRGTPIPTSVRTNFLAGDLSYLGTDLSDDHPVSFVYARVLGNPEVRSPSGSVKLDASGQMQCTACHSPHDDANGKFLVVNNIQSALCTNCHQKTGWPASIHMSSTKTWNGAGANPWPHTSYNPQNLVNNGCESCHRPHTAPGKSRLLNTDVEENNCLVCHNGNIVSPATKNIQAELAKGSRHGVANFANAHDAAETDPVSTVHVECVDCHNPHAANTAPGSIPGGTSITLPGSLAQARGVDIAGTAVQPVVAEYQICFRCHADSASKPTPSRTSRQIAQDNTRLEFEITNPSFHPIAGIGKSSNVPSLISPWTTSSIMTCSDCHNNNAGPNAAGTGPNGPHGSIYPLLLERQYVVTDRTSESASNYALCYKCHSRTVILGNQGFREHSMHISGQRTPCNVCHDPHGISSTQGSARNARLINFDTSVVTPSSGRLYWESTGTNRGRCYLVCHGKNHSPESY